MERLTLQQQDRLRLLAGLSADRWTYYDILWLFITDQSTPNDFTYDHKNIARGLASRLQWLDTAYLDISVTLPFAKRVVEALQASRWSEVISLLEQYEKDGPAPGLR